jgi:hypothetical protein
MSDNPKPLSQTPEGVTNMDLPPGFAWLGFGHDRFVLVNDNSCGHRSQWTDAIAMREAAWGWWHDVKNGITFLKEDRNG